MTARDEHSRSWASPLTRTPTELDQALFGVGAALSGLSKRVAAWSTNRTLVARRLRLRVMRPQVTVDRSNGSTAAIKAFTARVFDSPVRSFHGVQVSNQGWMMIFVNGIPLRHDGQSLKR